MYTLRKMSRDKAYDILEDVLKLLSDIEPEKLTTFEFNLLHAIAKNPPTNGGGLEEMLNIKSEDD